MNTITVLGNDAVYGGTITATWSDQGRAIVSPLGLEFVRGDGSYEHKSFSMSKHSAKQLAMFILENL